MLLRVSLREERFIGRAHAQTRHVTRVTRGEDIYQCKSPRIGARFFIGRHLDQSPAQYAGAMMREERPGQLAASTTPSCQNRKPHIAAAIREYFYASITTNFYYELPRDAGPSPRSARSPISKHIVIAARACYICFKLAR